MAHSCIDEDDEDDPYVDVVDDEFGEFPSLYFGPVCSLVLDPDMEYLDYNEDSVDTDMLLTMLVYHLVLNWVRVDWEAGGAGVEELLVKWVPWLLPLSFLSLSFLFLPETIH
jgi:hypothetical protein